MYNLVRDLGPLYGLGRLTAGTPQVDNAGSKTWPLCNLVFLPPHPRPLVSPWAIVAIIIFITFLFVITLWYIVASGTLILNDIADHGSFSTLRTGLMSMHMFTTRPQTCEGLLPVHAALGAVSLIISTSTSMVVCIP